MSKTGSPVQPMPGWDEAQCISSLAHLEQLQAQVTLAVQHAFCETYKRQLDDLRLAIPRIIEPFRRPTNSMTFKWYAQGVIGSQNGINNLSDYWKSSEIQHIFEHVKKSLSADPDLAESATIPSHGWVQKAQEQTLSKEQDTTSENVVGSVAMMTDEEISQVILDFQKTFPHIKWNKQKENRNIMIQFVYGTTMTKFFVNIERDASGQGKLNAGCLGTREPFLSMSRCISSRPRANDLRNLLDMIAAYKVVNGTSCAKCEKFLDDFMLSPTARRSKTVSGTDESTETIWQAFHEGCIA